MNGFLGACGRNNATTSVPSARQGGSREKNRWAQYPPAKRFYYFPVEECIQDLFADPEWVEGRGAQRAEWEADPRYFQGSAAAARINNKTGNALN